LTSRSPARPIDWDRVLAEGTGFFEGADLVATLEARPAREKTWRCLLDGELLSRFRKGGVSEDLVKAAALYLAEVTYRARTEEPSPGSLQEAIDIITKGAPGDPKNARRAMQQRVHALHYGRPPRAFEGAGRSRGAPGERPALGVFSALAEALHRRSRRTDWTLLMDLRDMIDPPLLVGLRIAPRTQKHSEIPHRTNPTKSTTLWRAPGDALRSAVNTYRRESGRTGGDDLSALETQLNTIRTRP